MKVRLPIILAVALLCLAVSLVWLPAFRGVSGINGFSPNQELALPLTAGQLPVRFIVRGLEPGVRVDQQGAVYVDSIRGVPTGFDLHRWSPGVDSPANADGTYPFQYMGRPDGCGILNTGCDYIGIGEGGGDADMAVNFPPSPTDVPNLAMSSLTLAPGVTATNSADRGVTFSGPNPVAALIPGDDREWMDAIDAQTVYLSYHDVATFNIEVQRSTDGGEFYTNGFGEAIDFQTFPAAGGLVGSANTAGQIRVDNTACPSRGNLYSFFVAPDNATENTMGGPLRSGYVGVSTDAKLNMTVYTFTDYKIFTSPAGSLGATNGANNIFPALAVDGLGFVYAAWSDNSNIFFSSSADQGATWTSPFLVNQGATVGMANVFPWVAADADGHVGIVWFGADRAGNSNDRTVMEPGHPASQGAACNDGTTTCMTKWANWNVYYAESLNAHGATPVFAQTVASDHVIHRGTLSTGGLGGGADRSLADFFQIAFDPQHRANVAFSDDHKVSPLGPDNGPDNPTTRRLIRANFTHQLMPNPGIVTFQSGSCVPNPAPQPGNKMTGNGQLGSSINFAFIVKDTPMNGVLSYQDASSPSGPLDVRSSGGVDSVTFSGNCAAFTGSAKVNHQPGYRFQVTACDNGDPNPGSGQDTFNINVTGPFFSYGQGGTITSGDLELSVKQ